MLSPQVIAIDAMGGDYGLSVTVPAAVKTLSLHSDLRFILVGNADEISAMLKKKSNKWRDRIEIQHATEVVEMDESPAQALRYKKDSSMRVALNLVKEGRASACVSAGNTGALMASARFVLKTIPGIDRPAIITRFPTETEKTVRVLDLGANINCTAHQLVEFAVMGSVLAKAADGIENPRVALLNIGQEEMKGVDAVREASELLSKNPQVNYIGYVEGDAIFTGEADVIVCDGFVGNAVLKSCEGLAKLISKASKEEFKKNWIRKLSAMPMYPLLKSIMERMDPRQRNGATMLGLRGVVIKSHGSADEVAFIHALQEAILEMNKNIPSLIEREVTRVLQN